ncbi:Phosphatidylinositol N-acetylglucosaminyltransferase subunit H [Acromyrmex echinatior]|uniref:Phosphatidylinositol N-acetylglucosaminyltransferase subunit H n=1 Tax=Acromyrmex echinatior TaxID=103372 RepID=F4WC62_ACREC|nr:Phosphatidylinositol N-acetylglucosaminyltransferase subunit H [Acromyrmex echinatior]
MSSSFLTQSLTTEVFFRNANGIQLTLEEKTSSNLSNVIIINFALRSEKHFNVNLCLTLVCAILFIWFVSGASVLLIVSGCLLILQCKSFVTSIKQDTLLVVKSVGVHIENKRGFGIFTSIEFLPWDTIEDIFINEVIKGQRVLYCLTFIVKESVGRQDSRRLVPVFQDLLPERKCLEYIYEPLANLIGSTKKKSLC